MVRDAEKKMCETWCKWDEFRDLNRLKVIIRYIF